MSNAPIRLPAHGFLAWPAASSMVFLVSAASLLGGVWSLLAPGLADNERLGERFGAVGILHLYQCSLLAVGWLLCRWRSGNPDAIGIAVLATCFAIGTAAGLDTIALDQPKTTVALGFAALPLLALGGWWLVRRVLGGCEPFLACAGLILVAWHTLAPGWFGWSFAVHLADVEHRDPQGEWLTGVILSTAIPVALLPLATRFSTTGDRDAPFLRRPGMRWILLLVLLVAGVLHLLLLDHAFTLERGPGSCLTPLALALLIANELRHRTWGDSAGWDVVAVGAPVVAVLIAAVSGQTWPAWTDALATPAGTAILIATAAMGLGRIRGRMIDLGLGAGLAALLTWHADPHWTGLNWNAFLLSAPLAMTALALRHRRSEWAIGAIIVAAYAVVMLPDILLRLLLWGLAPAALLVLVAGGGILLLATLLRLGTRIARIAAWGFALGAYHCCLRDASALHAPFTGVALVALALGAAAWVRRDPPLLLPLTLPVADAVLRARWAWLGIGSAFALLAAGAWLSWLRIHRPAPTKSVQISPPAMPRQDCPPA